MLLRRCHILLAHSPLVTGPGAIYTVGVLGNAWLLLLTPLWVVGC